MSMKTPKFWYPSNKDQLCLASCVLSPVSHIYQHIHKYAQYSSKPKKLDIPVICIGNITAGGGGKTPTCIALKQLISNNISDLKISFLSRGYGSPSKQVKRVKSIDKAISVGDEPILLAKHAPTFISPNRFDGAKAALEDGAQCIIMDDGLYNQTLQKDISFLVIDGHYGLGNMKTIPSGPLREPLNTTLKKIDAVIIIGEDKHQIREQLNEVVPVFKANIKPNTDRIDKNRFYIAFTGIALPQKFFKTLEESNIKASKTYDFPDHHHFTKAELKRLTQEAQESDACLITTEKDHVRLPDNVKNAVKYLPISLEWKNEDELLKFLKEKLQ